jgi:hypothetical protein
MQDDSKVREIQFADDSDFDTKSIVNTNDHPPAITQISTLPQRRGQGSILTSPLEKQGAYRNHNPLIMGQAGDSQNKSLTWPSPP